MPELVVPVDEPPVDEPQLPAPPRRRVLADIPTSATALLASVPSLLLLANNLRAMANSTEVPALVPPSLLAEARTANFITVAASGVPCILTFTIYEALNHAVAAAEFTTQRYDWLTTHGVDSAIEQARRFSVAGLLNLLLVYVVLFTIIYVFYFLPGVCPTSGLLCVTTGIGGLIFILGIAIGLSLVLRFMRVGIVRRERANTAAYVASLLPALGAVLIFQGLTFAYVFRTSGALPTVAQRHITGDENPERATRICRDEWINDNYTSTYCSLGAWTYLRPDVGSVTPLDLQQAIWVCDDPYNISDLTYRSRLDGCAALQTQLVLFGLMCAGMPLNICLLCCVIFQVSLKGIDAELTWRNWRERNLSRRARLSIALAVLGALWALVFAAQLFVYPRGTMFLDGGLTYTNLLGFIAVWLLAFATLAREFHVVRFNSGNDMTLIDGKSLREELVALVKARAANVDPSDRHVALNRLTGDVNQLRIGASKESALGLEESMKVGSQRLSFSMGAASEGVERIEKEFQTAVNVAREAHARAADEATRRDAAERLKNAENDFECLQYVLHSRAGSSDTVFANGNLKRDCDKGGNVRDDRLTFDGLGMQLQDFCNHPSARTAKLLTAHVVALRLYTTAAFVRLNSPLRDEDPNRPPHPFPVTMSYINAGISKLRAVGVKDGGLAKEDFWRGMRSLSFSDVRDQFLKEGGTVTAHPRAHASQQTTNTPLDPKTRVPMGAGKGADEYHGRPRHCRAVRLEHACVALPNQDHLVHAARRRPHLPLRVP